MPSLAVPKSWRLPAVITLIHIGLVLLVALLTSRPSTRRPRASIQASLVALPQTSAARRSPSQREPVARKRTSAPSESRAARHKPARKSWRARTPEEIRRSAQSQNRRTQTPSPRHDGVDTNKLRQELLSSLDGQVTEISSSQGRQVPASYLDRIRSLIYRSWQQPTAAQVGNRELQVTIRLRIARSGRIGAKAILHTSGNRTMDASVRQLLNTLTTAPAFPASITGAEIDLQIVLQLRQSR